MEEKMIAPCGMNCTLCIAFQFMKNDINRKGFHRRYCPGCIPRGNHCTHMGDKCEYIGKGTVRFCYECSAFPCKVLKSLDKRYRTKYHMSMIENLKLIKECGMEQFLEKEVEKWRCSKCNGEICCHNGLCLNCDLDILCRNKKYCWDEK
ncbi:MAG TPA: DUF3795 domain-containing protein [Bacillota bacterium]|nr:DUF3795 domain-containing protein [Bacillota bacterium]